MAVYKQKFLLRTFITLYSIALIMLIAFIGNLLYIIAQSPDLNVLTDTTADSASFDDLPKYISSAFLTAEDIRYYERPGMETRAVIKSLVRAATKKYDLPQEITVVQKLVKYAFKTKQNNFSRHLQEAYLAFLLENTYNRKQILQMYVNHTSFGEDIEGLSEACYRYFGKRPQDISISEAALLAAISKQPENYSLNINLQEAFKEKNKLLLTMHKNGFLNKQTYLAAQKEMSVLNKNLDQPAKAFEINY